MRVFSSVIGPAACVLVVGIFYYRNRCAVRSQLISYDTVWLFVPLHRFSHGFQCGVAMATPAHKTFKHLIFTIKCTLTVTLAFADKSAEGHLARVSR